ncbi:MAG: DNA translocase FtsK [Anaerolineales bacterium]
MGLIRRARDLTVRGLRGVWARLRDRKPEAGGLVMIAVGLFTLLTLLSPTQGAVGTSWLRVLRFLLGWGMILFPVLLIAIGLWLILRNFETELPALDLSQLVGAGMAVLALLVLLQAVTGELTYEGGLQVARQGRGGGVIGAASLSLLLAGFGAAGVVILLLAWTLAAGALMSGAGLPWLLMFTAGGVDRVGGWVRAQFAAQAVPVGPMPSTGAAGSSAAVPTEVDPAGAVEGRQDVPSPPAPGSESKAQADWKLPELDAVLEVGEESGADVGFNRDRGRLIEDTLRSFGAPAKVVEINQGPTITQFGVEPDFVEARRGRRVKVKVSKISSLADDLALALAAPSIRVEAPVPGKGFVGIEVPNPDVTLVALRDVMESKAFEQVNSRLRIALGRDVSGQPVAADLATMPHLLIAGTTGAGKSVCINAIIAGLLLQNTPAQLRFIMVDPKRVELTNYNGIPHLLSPVVVELERVVPVLQWISREMDERYHRFAEVGVRNIADFNGRMRQDGKKELPYLTLIVDELADLMMMAPDETERALTRLAQLARATGIHLVIATQRPSVDVVTGLIKANFPARIAFAVASSIDSRVILDQPGAERLLGQGDMLFQAPDAAMPRRLQGVYVSEPELTRLIRYWKTESLDLPPGEKVAPEPAEAIPVNASLKQAPLWDEIEEAGEEIDEMFDEAVDLVRRRRRASISMLQRRLRIGYTRAARLIDHMERRGIVGPEPGGSKAREVLDYGDLADDNRPPGT